MIRHLRVTWLVISIVGVTAAGCKDDAPRAECDGLDAQLIDVKVDADADVDASQIATGWLVPLEFKVASDCFVGIAHVSVTASSGQFSSTASSSNTKTGASDGGTGGDAGSSAQAAGTSVVLTPTIDRKGLVGYATLLLSNGQLSSHIQVVIGDSTRCVLVDATGASPQIRASCN